ncbi:MAG: protein-glutamine glutaminase family protein [Bdellovibrionales bacterium]
MKKIYFLLILLSLETRIFAAETDVALGNPLKGLEEISTFATQELPGSELLMVTTYPLNNNICSKIGWEYSYLKGNFGEAQSALFIRTAPYRDDDGLCHFKITSSNLKQGSSIGFSLIQSSLDKIDQQSFSLILEKLHSKFSFTPSFIRISAPIHPQLQGKVVFQFEGLSCIDQHSFFTYDSTNGNLLKELSVLPSCNASEINTPPSSNNLQDLEFLEKISIENLKKEAALARDIVINSGNGDEKTIPWALINENCSNRALALSWYFSAPKNINTDFTANNVKAYYEDIKKSPRIKVGEISISGPIRTTQIFSDPSVPNSTFHWPYHVANIVKTDEGLYVIDLSHIKQIIPLNEWLQGLVKNPDQCSLESYEVYRETFMFWQAGLYALKTEAPQRFCSIHIAPAFFGGDSQRKADINTLLSSITALSNHSKVYDAFVEKHSISEPLDLKSQYKAQSYSNVCETTPYYICKFSPFLN